MEFIIVFGLQRWLLLSFQSRGFVPVTSCDGMLWSPPRLTATGAWNIAPGRGKGALCSTGTEYQCSCFYLCPHLSEVNLAISLAVLSACPVLLSQGCWAKPAAGKCGFMSLGIALSFIVTSHVGNLGIFSVLVNTSEKPPWIQEAWSL